MITNLMRKLQSRYIISSGPPFVLGLLCNYQEESSARSRCEWSIPSRTPRSAHRWGDAGGVARVSSPPAQKEETTITINTNTALQIISTSKLAPTIPSLRDVYFAHYIAFRDPYNALIALHWDSRNVQLHPYKPVLSLCDHTAQDAKSSMSAKQDTMAPYNLHRLHFTLPRYLPYHPSFRITTTKNGDVES